MASGKWYSEKGSFGETSIRDCGFGKMGGNGMYVCMYVYYRMALEWLD